MEFRILGPLEVREEGRLLPLASAKQRALLAILLLNANQVVSRERLIDELWGREPPETAVKALQVHVSQLRKVLERAGAGRLLRTRAPGYVLDVDPEKLDLHRVARLLAEGRRLLADGDHAAASAKFVDALALWRGQALAEFALEPFAQAEIARIEELRIGALEDRIEADLALGRHTELTGELEALVAQQPLRERLRGQLMLALYRSGRQADALAAYREARRGLVEELGIEPGRDLQRLQKAILVQDPSLDRPAPSAVPEKQPQPPTPAAPPGPTEAPPPERKLVSVLFGDLVGSTELGESEDPERTRMLLDRFYNAMAAEIEAAGGTLEKFVGDAVMAVFGAPAAQEDHAERALHTALSMQRRLDEVFGAALRLHVGVNTGEVVVGPARTGGSFVTGDAVNVAARLQHAAAPGEILVGERTVAAVGGAFEFGRPATVEAKGKRGGVSCRRLERALSLARPRGVGGLQPVFVGRENEVDLLRATYRHAVREAEPHLVTIMGDAGVGKTSLAHELWSWLAAQSPKPLVRTGRCLSYGRGITYWPLGEVLKAHLGILESDPEEVVRSRLREREILALTLGLEAGSDLHPLVARERLHEAWVEFLGELVAKRPVAVLVEDLHWAEEPLLDLLDRLVRDVAGPLLLLGTARPELHDRRPDWGGGRRNVATLWLQPLSGEEAERMLGALLAADLPRQMRDIVVERAEGNPFFVEELIAALIDQGVLKRRDGGWAVGSVPSEFAVPDSVHAALASRIDLLDSAQKAALQAASVIGRVFWSGPVAELLEGVELDFGVLAQRDFIRRRASSSMAGQREFAFKHALTREVAYSTLPRARRARLHAAVAAWIERVGEGRDEQAPLLAHHYAEAVRPEDVDLAWPGEHDEVERLRDRALTWLRRAAELAAGRYALDEQIGLLERAVELTQSDAVRVELWREIGHANALRYDEEAFKTAMVKAADACADAEALAEVYSELAFQVAIRWQQAGERDLIDEWAEQALGIAGPFDRTRARALVARAICRPHEAEELAREATTIAARLGDPELQSYALHIRVDIALGAGDYEEARRLVEERLALLSRIGDPDHRADAYWAALPAYCGLARFDDARRIARLHDEVTGELTPHHRLHGVAVVLEVEELAGNWQQIRGLTPRVKRLVAANDTRCLHNRRSLLVCALANAYLGHETEARRLEHAADSLDIRDSGRVDVRVRLALLRGALETVERLIGESEQLLRVRKLAPMTARLDALAALGRREQLEEEASPLPGTYLEPFALRALGTVRAEDSLIERAAALFDSMGLDWHAAQTRAVLAAGQGGG